MTVFSGLNEGFSGTEKLCNLLGYIPFVGSGSAVARAVFGKVQIITGLFMATLNFLASLMTPDSDKQKDFELKAVKSLEYCVHGVLNTIRALFEFVPFVSLMTCLPYDLAGFKILHYTPYNPPMSQSHQTQVYVYPTPQYYPQQAYQPAQPYYQPQQYHQAPTLFPIYQPVNQ